MPTVAIIAEYNPFHKGHEHQIKKIREMLGEDTRIIAIMSGNAVQRGDIAILDKYTRAECAVLSGVNLVLELPFPFCSASAELFAASGVKIADSLGVVDYLAFGSESGDIDELTKIADIMNGDTFKGTFAEISADNRHLCAGYPELIEEAYKRATGRTSAPLSPNNILGVEYIKQLKAINSKITPITIKREGAHFNEENITGTGFESATAIRALGKRDPASCLELIPNSSRDTVAAAISEGLFPASIDNLSSTIIPSLLLNSPVSSDEIHDATGGLYNRLIASARRSVTISELVSLSETKRYTNARIRRALLFSYLGVTSSKVKALPAYTQVLASDKVGFAILARARKSSAIPILTKPTDTDKLGKEAMDQKALCDRVDILFGFATEKRRGAQRMLSRTPYVIK